MLLNDVFDAVVFDVVVLVLFEVFVEFVVFAKNRPSGTNYLELIKATLATISKRIKVF